MKRIALAAAFVSAVVVSFAACSDQAYYDEPAYSRGPVAAGCSRYATCGACTPVPGCGWCSTGGGGGYCSSDPYACNQGAATWNWNPQGCRAGADAAVVGPHDAAATSDASDASNADAPSDAPAPTDAAPDVVR